MASTVEKIGTYYWFDFLPGKGPNQIMAAFDKIEAKATKVSKGMRGVGITKKSGMVSAAAAGGIAGGMASVSKSTDRATKSMDKYGHSSVHAAGIFDLFRKQFTWFLGATGIFAIIGGISAATREWGLFHQAMKDIGAVSGATQKELEALRKTALQVAFDTNASTSEITSGLLTLIQAGVDVKSANEAIGAAAKLAVAPTATLTDGIELLTTAMFVFDRPASRAHQTLNIIAGALDESKLEAQGMGVAMSYSAAQAKLAGWSFEQLSATIAVLSNAGLKYSTIGTGLARVLSELLNPGKKFRDMLREIHVEVEEINPLTNDFFDIIKKLKDAGIGVVEIFGGMEQRGARLFANAINMGDEAFTKMLDSITKGDRLNRLYTQSMTGMVNRLKQLRNHIILLIFGGFDKLEGKIITVIERTKDFVDMMLKVTGVAKDFNQEIGITSDRTRDIAIFIASVTFQLKALWEALTTGITITKAYVSFVLTFVVKSLETVINLVMLVVRHLQRIWKTKFTGDPDALKKLGEDWERTKEDIKRVNNELEISWSETLGKMAKASRESRSDQLTIFSDYLGKIIGIMDEADRAGMPRNPSALGGPVGRVVSGGTGGGADTPPPQRISSNLQAHLDYIRSLIEAQELYIDRLKWTVNQEEITTSKILAIKRDLVGAVEARNQLLRDEEDIRSREAIQDAKDTYTATEDLEKAHVQNIANINSKERLELNKLEEEFTRFTAGQLQLRLNNIRKFYNVLDVAGIDDFAKRRAITEETTEFLKDHYQERADILLAIERWRIDEVKRISNDEIDASIRHSESFVEGWQLAYAKSIINLESYAQIAADTFDKYMNTIERSLSDVFTDGFKGQLKTAEGYWQAFLDNIASMWGKAFAKITMKNLFSGEKGDGNLLSDIAGIFTGAGGDEPHRETMSKFDKMIALDEQRNILLGGGPLGKIGGDGDSKKSGFLNKIFGKETGGKIGEFFKQGGPASQVFAGATGGATVARMFGGEGNMVGSLIGATIGNILLPGIGGFVGGALGGMFGGGKKGSVEEELIENNSLLENILTEVVLLNRNMVGMIQDFKPYILPTSAYFSERAGTGVQVQNMNIYVGAGEDVVNKISTSFAIDSKRVFQGV